MGVRTILRSRFRQAFPVVAEATSLWAWRFRHHLRFALDPDYPEREMVKACTAMFGEVPIGRDSLVIDVGGNEGWFSLLAAKKGARVVMLEPNPWTFRRAVARLAPFQKQVIPLNVALSHRTGPQKLFYPRGYRTHPELFSGSMSLTPWGFGHSRSDDYLWTWSITVSQLVSAFPQVDFLKLDIEGAEERLWPQLERHQSNFRYVAIETHEHKGSENPVWRSEAEAFISKQGLGGFWSLSWP